MRGCDTLSATMRKYAPLVGMVIPIVAANAGLAAPTVVRYLPWQVTGSVGQVAKDQVELFNKTHKDIRVQILANAGEPYERFLVMSAAGAAPDVADVASHWAWKLMEADLIQDLKPYIKQDKFDLTNYAPAYVNIWRYGDKQSGLPFNYNTNGIAYNSDLLARSGVAAPILSDRNTKWDFNEYLSVLQKCTKDTNGDGNVDVWGTDMCGEWSWDYYVYGMGGALVNADSTKSLVDRPGTVRGLQFLADLVHKYKVAPVRGWPKGDFTLAFPKGKVALVQASSWMFDPWRESRALKWDLMSWPYDVKPYQQVSGGGYVMASQSKRKQASWEFIKFMLGDESQKISARSKGYSTPSNLRIARSRIYLDQNPPENMRLLVEDTLLADASNTGNGTPLPTQFDALYKETFEKVYMGKDTAANQLRIIAPTLQKYLDTWNAKRRARAR